MSAVRASKPCPAAGSSGSSHERSSFGDYCIRCRRTLVSEDPAQRRDDDEIPPPLYDESEVDEILATERPRPTSRRSYGTTGRRIG